MQVDSLLSHLLIRLLDYRYWLILWCTENATAILSFMRGFGVPCARVRASVAASETKRRQESLGKRALFLGFQQRRWQRRHGHGRILDKRVIIRVLLIMMIRKD